MAKNKNGAVVDEEQDLHDQLAGLVEKLEPALEAVGEIKTLREKVEAVGKLVEPLNGFDAKAVAESVDKIKAAQETLQKQIRTSRKGLYVSGIEDVEFNLTRALLGRACGWDKIKGAGHEKEIIKQATEKAISEGLYGKAAHTAGDDVSIGDLIPDQVIPDIISAIYTRSVFFGLDGSGETRVSVLEGLFGGNVKVPKFLGGLIAYWLGEEDEYAESLMKAGDLTMTEKKLGILVRLTKTMQERAGYGFDRLLRQDMSRAAAKKFDWTIAFGTGGDMPLGVFRHPDVRIYRAENGTVLTQDDALAVADWQGGEVDFDKFDDMALALEEDDVELGEDMVSFTSPRYIRRLKRLKILTHSGQTSGQPYLLGAPMLTNTKLRELIGDFATTSQFKSNNKPGASIGGATTSANLKYTDLLRGDPRTIVVGRWAGVEITDDEGKGKGFTRDHIYMKLRMTADVQVREGRQLIACPDAKARD